MKKTQKCLGENPGSFFLPIRNMAIAYSKRDESPNNIIFEEDTKMIKVVAIILTAAIAVVVLGSVGFVAVKTGENMINQKYSFGDAIGLAWEDYTIFLAGIIGNANAEDDGYFEYPITTNMYIEVKACTGL